MYPSPPSMEPLQDLHFVGMDYPHFSFFSIGAYKNPRWPYGVANNRKSVIDRFSNQGLHIFVLVVVLALLQVGFVNYPPLSPPVHEYQEPPLLPCILKKELSSCNLCYYSSMDERLPSRPKNLVCSVLV